MSCWVIPTAEKGSDDIDESLDEYQAVIDLLVSSVTLGYSVW